MWDRVKLKWDVAGKENARSVGSLGQKRLKDSGQWRPWQGKYRTRSGVNKALVESWVVGEAVRKVSITKQADWTLICLKPFLSGIYFSFGKVTLVSKPGYWVKFRVHFNT